MDYFDCSSESDNFSVKAYGLSTATAAVIGALTIRLVPRGVSSDAGEAGLLRLGLMADSTVYNGIVYTGEGRLGCCG
jgi:hypothetical protein